MIVKLIVTALTLLASLVLAGCPETPATEGSAKPAASGATRAPPKASAATPDPNAPKPDTTPAATSAPSASAAPASSAPQK